MLEGKVLAAAILHSFVLEVTPELRGRMAAGAGELPLNYSAGVINFPEPLRLRARRRPVRAGAGSGAGVSGGEVGDVPAKA